MMRKAQKYSALTLAVPAALVTVVCVVILLADWIEKRAQTPLYEQREEALLEQSKQEAAAAVELDAEHLRQTDESLARKASTKQVAWTLIIAGAVFVLSAKWLFSLRETRPPTLSTIIQLRAPPSPATRTVGDRRDRHTPPRQPGAGPPKIDLSFVDDLVARIGHDREAAVPILQAIQAHYGYLPNEALQRVCELTEIEPAQIAGVSTFYARFRRSPVGEHIVKICHGTACHVAGARQITEEIRRHLQIAPDEDTDPNRMFTVDRVACLGCCSLAPVMMIDEETVGRLTPASACEALDTVPQEQPA
jgi:NADH:ubiquinone oxidoreductase subunit E